LTIPPAVAQEAEMMRQADEISALRQTEVDQLRLEM
jgi:hypothetical protein